MKCFLLLELIRSANKVWAEHTCATIQEAISYFKTIYPELNLDENGYNTDGDKSFCVGEKFNPISH